MSATVLWGDTISRQVAFAVELLDPVTGALVSTPATVAADGLAIGPVNNLSGRFVFLAQAGVAGTVRVDLHGLPYEPISSPPPAPGQNLLRLTLQPTPLYPFEASATLLSGKLVDGGVPVAGAAIGAVFADKTAQHQALPARTDGSGAFAVLLRLDPTAVASADPVMADLTLTITRSSTTRSRPGLRAVAGAKTATDIASSKPVTQFDWAAL
jgi:hypothetical protein